MFYSLVDKCPTLMGLFSRADNVDARVGAALDEEESPDRTESNLGTIDAQHRNPRVLHRLAPKACSQQGLPNRLGQADQSWRSKVQESFRRDYDMNITLMGARVIRWWKKAGFVDVYELSRTESITKRRLTYSVLSVIHDSATDRVVLFSRGQFVRTKSHGFVRLNQIFTWKEMNSKFYSSSSTGLAISLLCITTNASYIVSLASYAFCQATQIDESEDRRDPILHQPLYQYSRDTESLVFSLGEVLPKRQAYIVPCKKKANTSSLLSLELAGSDTPPSETWLIHVDWPIQFM